MATTGVNKAIDALVNAKADAYSNMYDVWIQFPWESSKSRIMRPVISSVISLKSSR